MGIAIFIDLFLKGLMTEDINESSFKNFPSFSTLNYKLLILHKIDLITFFKLLIIGIWRQVLRMKTKRIIHDFWTTVRKKKYSAMSWAINNYFTVNLFLILKIIKKQKILLSNFVYDLESLTKVILLPYLLFLVT